MIIYVIYMIIGIPSLLLSAWFVRVTYRFHS